MNSLKPKLFALAAFAVPTALVFGLGGTPNVQATAAPEDAAAIYKAKCAMCHTPTASKHFDIAKSDEHHVQAILKGQKGEKPPYMPGYEEKGITEETAKALVVYMRSIKPAS
ncbi:MAG: cytochrome c [Blastocatellia bacterium]|jgi:mono/diheme cytochrome c family protein|nr:cytochrome c [Blastocatellia bacterium]